MDSIDDQRRNLVTKKRGFAQEQYPDAQSDLNVVDKRSKSLSIACPHIVAQLSLALTERYQRISIRPADINALH